LRGSSGFSGTSQDLELIHRPHRPHRRSYETLGFRPRIARRDLQRVRVLESPFARTACERRNVENVRYIKSTVKEPPPSLLPHLSVGTEIGEIGNADSDIAAPLKRV
jgi:hypothetical protein